MPPRGLAERAWSCDHPAARGRVPVIVFLAHFLIVLAAWTVTIKFLFPIAYVFGEGAPVGTYIYWDLWWDPPVARLGAPALADVHLCARGHCATIEIAIVVTKFVLFLAEARMDHLDDELVHQQAVRARLLLPDAAVLRPLRARPAPASEGQVKIGARRARSSSALNQAQAGEHLVGAVRHLDPAELLEGLGVIDRDVRHGATRYHPRRR